MPPKADPTTTAPKKPPKKTTTGAGGGNDTPTSTDARGTGTATISKPLATTTTFTSSQANASPTLPPSTNGGSSTTGLSTGAIGGIAGGAAVVLLGLIGLVVYKRKKRRASDSSKDGGQPMYMNPSNYKKKKGPPGLGISGPLALAPETEDQGREFFDPKLAQQRLKEQQQIFNVYDREVKSQSLKSPTSPKSPYNKKSFDRDYKSPTGDYASNNNNNNNNNSYRLDNNSQDALRNDFYDEYFGEKNDGRIMDQPLSSPIQSGDVNYRNISPAPQYYLGKEDIDPKRDLRGMDKVENYIQDKKTPLSPLKNSFNQQNESKTDQRQSLSSEEDDEEGYMTLEQAQQAHQRKMMGHKESIGSSHALFDNSKPKEQQQQQQGQAQSQKHNDNPISPTSPTFRKDPPAVISKQSPSSPMPFTPSGANGSYSNSNAGPSSPRDRAQHGPTQGPPYPHAYEAPYAESSFSEDFVDIPVQSPHNGIGASPSPLPIARTYSPYPGAPYSQHSGYQSPGPYSPRPGYRPGPGYGPAPSSPYNDFSGPRSPPPQYMNGPGGYGGQGQGYGRPGPGYGSPGMGRGPPPQNYNGYPARVASPGMGGYRPPPQRDPGYNNQGQSQYFGPH